MRKPVIKVVGFINSFLKWFPDSEAAELYPLMAAKHWCRKFLARNVTITIVPKESGFWSGRHLASR